MNGVKLKLNPVVFSAKIAQLQKEKHDLEVQLQYERSLRENVEKENAKLKLQLESKKRHRRTKAEMLEAENKEYSEYKTNGQKKASKAETINSYDDYIRIRDFLASDKNNGIRNKTLWTLGVALGIRVSDLVKLKYKYFFNEDGSFRKRLYVFEQKTLKLNRALITPVIKQALNEYIDSIFGLYDYNDYIFRTSKDKHIQTNTVYKIFKPAQEVLDLSFNFGTHTMRKSFANIAACCGIKAIDMNTIATIQGLLNHNDQTTTLRYMGKFEDLYDDARNKVSEFLLGRTDNKVLNINSNHSIGELYEQLDNIEKILNEKKEDNNAETNKHFTKTINLG